MATPQVAHESTIIDTWIRKFRGRTFTTHPIDGNSTIGPTTSQNVSSLLLESPGSAFYTPGTFTVPANAVPTFNPTTRRAEYAPMSFTITCKQTAPSNLQFTQYFILIDEATTNPIVHCVRAPLPQAITLAPGGAYLSGITLSTD